MTQYSGCVKWFNKKAGFGFITIQSGDLNGSDVFVHFSAIKTDNIYKYLVDGEYVEVTLGDKVEGHDMPPVVNVEGVRGGQLMCQHRVSNKRQVDESSTNDRERPVERRERPVQRRTRPSYDRRDADRTQTNRTQTNRTQTDRTQTDRPTRRQDKR